MRLAAGAALLALAACATPSPAVAPAAACPAGGAAMTRVELIFGLGLKDGADIGEPAWLRFLETEVTPRFPDGLTAYDAYGQWLHPERGVVRLRSKVLQIWYAPSPDAEARIEAIRAAFKSQFDQLSVMRVDGTDCVSF